MSKGALLKMKNTIYIFFFCCTSLLQAQNITQKTFSDKDITTIHVDGENVFKIVVEAKPVDTITIYSRVEGEYHEAIVLVTESQNNNLYIAAKLQPVFKDENDKLSAHKVISIELKLVIPESLNLHINSTNATVVVHGLYKKVRVNTTQGNCFFNAFYGNAKIDTRDGNIALDTNHATILATSKNGYIKKEKIDSGTNQIVLKTINGNITVNALTNSQ